MKNLFFTRKFVSVAQSLQAMRKAWFLNMKKTYILIGILFGTALMSACGSNTDTTANGTDVTVIQAEYPVYDTAEEIVDASDLVFSGTVTGTNYKALNVKAEAGADSQTGLATSSEIPYTIFEINVEQVYKGNVEGASISIKRPGGEMDGKMYAIEDASTIETGETYLFITETYENSYSSLLNVTQASYNLNAPETLDHEDENAGITLSEVMEYLDSIN